jgi:hypothetical protein
MTMFHKNKDVSAPAPALCDRCHERRGVLRIQCVSVADIGSGDDVWLCSECVDILRPDDPSRS